MFAFFKGVLAGAILSFVIAGLVGHTGSTGGILNVFHFMLHGYRLYWSWGVFVGGALLGWVVFALLE